jgi:hypothetical protein
MINEKSSLSEGEDTNVVKWLDEFSRSLGNGTSVLHNLQRKKEEALARGDFGLVSKIEEKLRRFFANARKLGFIKPDPFDVDV